MQPSDAESAADDGTPQRLFNRHFLLLWQGQTVSGVGISLSQIATVYWLLQETGSATTMGLVSMPPRFRESSWGRWAAPSPIATLASG